MADRKPDLIDILNPKPRLAEQEAAAGIGMGEIGPKWKDTFKPGSQNKFGNAPAGPRPRPVPPPDMLKKHEEN